mmetsp:Transcript_14664/g.34589  ORF Transcript_14664/g.34589 Transcript_14664/m.34589 type:complete len:247 (-) Transcript_14664:729-1469(-)
MLEMEIHSAAPAVPANTWRSLQTPTEEKTMTTVMPRVRPCCFIRFSKVTSTSSQNTSVGSGASLTASTFSPFQMCSGGTFSLPISKAAVSRPALSALRHLRCPASVSKVMNTFEGTYGVSAAESKATWISSLHLASSFLHAAMVFIPKMPVFMMSTCVRFLASALPLAACSMDTSSILSKKLLPSQVMSRIPSSSSSCEALPLPMMQMISRITARRLDRALSSGPLFLATVTKVAWPNCATKSNHS